MSDAKAMLKDIVENKWLYSQRGLWDIPANTADNDVIEIYGAHNDVIAPFPNIEAMARKTKSGPNLSGLIILLQGRAERETISECSVSLQALVLINKLNFSRLSWMTIAQ